LPGAPYRYIGAIVYAFTAGGRGTCRARCTRARSVRCLRSQRQRAVAAVLERVHLLVDDVGCGARGALEEPGVLEARRLNAPPAIEPRGRAPSRARAATSAHRPAARRACPSAPGTWSSGAPLEPAAGTHDGRSARSSLRYGFEASSRPSVVASLCADLKRARPLR
jgi:hypothetical protein